MKERILQALDVMKSEGLKSTASKIYRYLGMQVLGVDFYNKPLVNCIKTQTLAKKYQTYVDIGAHVGTILVRVANLFECCMGVEPSERNLIELRRSVKCLGDNCKIFPVALGSKEGRVTLYESVVNTGDNSVSPRSDLVSGRSVPMITLDTLIERERTAGPFLIKIDVQGNELSVFQGAERTLKSDCTIITEFWPWGLLAAGNDPNMLLEYMKLHGYVCHNLAGEELTENWLNRFCELGKTRRFVTTDLLYCKD
ncbi:MAG: FkbM family methyltransferase [Thaumarchaeota archaeon]|nr:FkbM family methyltransferase [Nitrososphaerota archaeon]